MTADQRDPEQIAADIERTREELGETAAALAAKADVKARMKDKAGQVRQQAKAKASDTADKVATAAAGTADKVATAASDATAQATDAAARTGAQIADTDVVQAVRRRPIPVVGVALAAAVVVAAVVAIRRARR
jgi:cobalamin biosynthesis Mg chelatase CobN